MRSYKYINYTKNNKGGCRIIDKGALYNKTFKNEKELEIFVDNLGYPIYSFRLLPLKERKDFWQVIENEIGCNKAELFDILIHIMYTDNEFLDYVKILVNHPHYFHV